MRILFTSDWHFDARFNSSPRWPEFRRFLAWLESILVREEIDVLLVGGDYFDPGRQTDLINAGRLICAARRLTDLLPDDGGSIWIAGNHDVINHSDGSTTLRPLREAALPGVTVIENHDGEPALIPLGTSPHAVLALPYVTGKVTGEPPWDIARYWLRNNTGHLVVLAHYDIPGALMGTESSEMARGRPYELPVKVLAGLCPDAAERLIVVNGHYHKPQTIAGVLPIHVPGSPLRLDFGERGDGCGTMIIDID